MSDKGGAEAFAGCLLIFLSIIAGIISLVIIGLLVPVETRLLTFHSSFAFGVFCGLHLVVFLILMAVFIGLIKTFITDRLAESALLNSVVSISFTILLVGGFLYMMIFHLPIMLNLLARAVLGGE